MARCKICGSEDTALPADWTNWECDDCFEEILSESAGQLSPDEKSLCSESHAWPAILGPREIR